MLTEGIHSSADTLNQVLLLIGTRRSHARPDASHAFGYGMEIYFWAFVVAVLVLFIGAAASFYEGVAELRHARPTSAPGVSLTVLALSMLLEGASAAGSSARAQAARPPRRCPRSVQRH
jgi:divalent metal cation (Fe/Co/Zn/Cd) transporter